MSRSDHSRQEIKFSLLMTTVEMCISLPFFSYLIIVNDDRLGLQCFALRYRGACCLLVVTPHIDRSQHPTLTRGNELEAVGA